MDDWLLSKIGPKFFSVALSEVKMNYLFSAFPAIVWDSEVFAEAFRATGHPDVDWFYSIFPTGPFIYSDSSGHDVKKTFISNPYNCGRNLYYAGLCCYGENCETERIKLLRECSKLNPKNMLYQFMSLDTVIDVTKYFEDGAKVGDCYSMIRFAETLHIDDRLRWLLKTSTRSDRYISWHEWFALSTRVKNISTLFLIGELSKRYGSGVCHFNNDKMIRNRKRIEDYYQKVLETVRCECVMWVLIAKQSGIQKDVRKVISMMIWESRFDGREN